MFYIRIPLPPPPVAKQFLSKVTFFGFCFYYRVEHLDLDGRIILKWILKTGWGHGLD